MILPSRERLEVASHWGDGFCLECGNHEPALTDLFLVSRCESCNMVAVLSAETLLSIADTLGDSG